MINEELLSKFDRIEDLPVSEEMLGAYLEDELLEEEKLQIENAIDFNDDLSDLFDMISQSEDVQSINISEFDFSEDRVIDIDDMPLIDNINLDQTMESQMTTNTNDNIQASVGASAASRIFGEQGNGSTPYSDPLIYQGNEGVCAIRSQQIILRDYGIDIPLEDLKQFAIQNGWYDPSGEGGTPMGYVGAILDSCGVEVKQDINCTVYDLINELAQGHRVIVGVDADELWADRNGSIIDKTTTWLNDVFGEEQANHALIVAGVEVNPNDPSDVKVILTDPGTGDLRIEYSFEEFMDAWEDSECFMVATTTPAPYQYDSIHGCEVPSNFAVEQYIAYNTLPLNADVRGVEMSEGYSAYYADGHVDVLGTDAEGNDVTYEKFHNEYTQLKQALGNMPGTLGQDHFDKAEFMTSLKKLFGFHNEQPDIPHPPVVPDSEPDPAPEPWPVPDDDDDDDDDEDDGFDNAI